MSHRRQALPIVLTLALAGCSAVPYSVKLEGDVQGTDSGTSRVVKPSVYFGSEARAMREAGGRHLHQLPDALIIVQLKFKGEEKPHNAVAIRVDSQSGKFFEQLSGDSKNQLVSVIVSVKCNGRQPIERELASAPDVPFEDVLMCVLEETVPGGPIDASTTTTVDAKNGGSK